MNLKEQENKINASDYANAYEQSKTTSVSYSDTGLTYKSDYRTDHKLVEKIEVLIKALGTMVLVPEYETSPDDFVKRYAGNVQKPILENEQRESTLKVLSELISQL